MSTTIPRTNSGRGGGLCRLAAPSLALLTLVAGCDECDDGPDLGPALPTTASVGAGATASLFLALGKSFATGAASGGGSTLTGWALGQLGLAGTDPTGDALRDIDATLQEIKGQLQDIAAEISELVNITVVANCQQLSAGLSSDLGRINTVLQTYETIVCTGSGTCANGAPPSNVSEAVLIGFMNSALDTAGGGQNGMAAILDRINQALVGGTQGGIITACVNPSIPGLAPPVEGTFNDAEYYTRVEPVAAFYYYYQTVAMLLYSEAQRYRAWVTAGSPGTGTLDPDEMSEFLLTSTDPDVIFIMNETANRMQATWNNLRNQFNLVGAPYTNDSLLLRNSVTSPVLYVLDLEDFSAAAGTPCADLTTDNYACTSALQGPYDLSSEPIQDLEYAGQPGGWRFATLQELGYLMDGWSGGYAYEYLEANDATTTRGFSHMKDKVLISDATATAVITFRYNGFPPYDSNWVFGYVPFLDGAFHHSTPGLNGRLPVDTTAAIREQLRFNFPPTPSAIYISSAERAPHDYLAARGRYEFTLTTGSMNWETRPGWLVDSPDQRTRAFHMPVIDLSGITPSTGLRRLNAAGVPTMCTADFDAWFEVNVPRPVFE